MEHTVTTKTKTTPANDLARGSKRKKRDNKSGKAVMLIAFIVVFIFIIIKLASNIGTPVKTEILIDGRIEDSINTQGYLIRNESVVTSSSAGVLSCVANEGERIKKGTQIASIFTGSVDDSLQNKLTRINTQLLELNSDVKKEYVAGDAIQVDKAVESLVSSIIAAANSNDVDKIEKYKDDINKLVASVNAGEGSARKATVDKKSQLLAEKAEVEASLGGQKTDLYAPVSGVFSSTIDGFEGYFNIKDRMSITPKVLKEADDKKLNDSMKITAGGPAVKVIDNYGWYFATVVSAKYVEDIKVGSDIMIRFPDISDLVLDATVDTISGVQDGKVTLVIACDKYVPDIYALRRVQADIIRSTYRGFKVSKSAIRIKDDGTTGVYVVSDNIAKFKNAEILYTNDKYAILKEDNSISNGVLLYDEVITEGMNIYDNKPVRQTI